MQQLGKSVAFSYIEEEAVNSDLKCPVCLDPLMEPVRLCEDHHLCLPCLQAMPSTIKCPVCKRDSPHDAEGNVAPLAAERVVLRLLGALCVKCQRCPWQGPRSEYNTHEERTCVGFSCPHESCSWSGRRDDLQPHLDSSCDYAVVPCPGKGDGCTATMERRLVKEHCSSSACSGLLQALLRKVSPTDTVTINVRSEWSTTVGRDILLNQKESLFPLLLSSVKDSTVFMDLDVDAFKTVLRWMRHGVVPERSDFSPPEWQTLGSVIEDLQLGELRAAIDQTCRSDVCYRLPQDQFLHAILMASLSGTAVVLPRVDLSGRYLLGVNLKGALLSGSNLEASKLNGVNLSSAKLISINLRSADLSSANLECANLTGADLTNAVFAGANLACANFTGVDLTNADLTGANLRSANFTGVDLTNADLAGFDLTSANFTGANLTNADLTGANLTSAELAGATLTGAKLSRTILSGRTTLPNDLTNFDFSEASLTDVKLKGADLTGVSFVGTKFIGSVTFPQNLTGLNLASTSFHQLRDGPIFSCRPDLRDKNFSGANLMAAQFCQGVGLTKSNFSGANLSGATLAGVYLYDSNLSGADLSGADLSGADLSGADLTGANVTGANLTDANLKGARGLGEASPFDF